MKDSNLCALPSSSCPVHASSKPCGGIFNECEAEDFSDLVDKLKCAVHYGKIVAPYIAVGGGTAVTVLSDGSLAGVGIPVAGWGAVQIEGQALNPERAFTPC
jgi:hypothetical protein